MGEPCELFEYLNGYQPSALAISQLQAATSHNGTVPFADAFAPMRQYAAELGGVPDDLADALVDELSRSFSQALFPRFALSHNYVAFVREMWEGGWGELLAELPVLARLLTQAVALKIAEARELAARLEADLPELRRFFQADLGPLVSIRSGMSDPHHGLRSVKILRFACGWRLVYKPKDLELDAAWAGLLDWFNQRAPLDLVAPRVLNRGTHGWTEYIPHVPAADAAGLQRFYRRSGALLALLYAIRGSDCHFENLIASGDQPVLVDTETLMQPDLTIDGNSLVASVTQSGLLPSRDTANGGEVVMSGGLDDAARRSTATRPTWQNVNTDRMTFGERARIEFSSANVPELDGVAVNAADCAGEVVAGFRDAYRLLMAHRDNLLSGTGPLAAFRGAAARFVVRNTRVYCVLLRCATLPQFLRDEAAYSDRVQALLARVGTIGVKPVELIAEVEAASLAAMDVPMFTTRTDSTSLFTDSGREIPDVMAMTGYDAVMEQIRGLNEDDLARQVAIIQNSFRAEPEAGTAAPSRDSWVERDWSADLFVTEARRLGDFLLNTAMRDEAGLDWVGMRLVPEIGQQTAQRLDHGLWGGRCGIALFLAALYRVTGEARYRRESVAAFGRTRRAIREGDLLTEGIGGGSGVGAVVYALTRAGEWLGDGSLTSYALAASALLTRDSIEEDRYFDVMSGAAGCLLGLLAADRYEWAELCAAHLMAHQEAPLEGGAAWRGKAPRPATGFAHGAAGIACALLRLDRCRPDARVRDAAHQAIAYERSNYCATAGNWLDVRALVQPDRPRFGSSWCHGAPGIGLARLGSLPSSDLAMQDEIAASLAWAERNAPPTADQLCCGKLGSIELMLRASQSLGKPELYERACRRAAGIVSESRIDGGYRLSDGAADDLANPGLFIGLAGIGYELLRLAEPQRLPSILLWE